IDDQYRPGLARADATRHDLRLALEELVAGRPVTVAATKAAGCLIGRVRERVGAAGVTYCGEVSRLLHQHCIECHRDGEIAPFALTDYDEVIGWADALLEAIDDGRMPPWHANPRHGRFANARFMPEADRQVLRDWVAAGASYGNVEDLPELPERQSNWRLARDPDLVLPMRDRPFVVPAEGTVEYQYFVVDPGFRDDKWVTSAQVIPGNRSVVHHAIVFVRPPDGAAFRGVGWLTGYVPGQRAAMLPEGYGRRIPAGSRLVVQMHYTPNGREQEDLTKVGLLFGNETDITHEALTVIGLDQEFEIPPHAADFAVTAAPRWLPDDGDLLAVAPHMHLRGKSFQLSSRASGRETILLDVPRYDFNWQHVYEFAEPLPLDSIDRLEFTARFDNSRRNPVNPDPAQHVTWGDQTWEEMAVAFFEVAVPRGAAPASRPARRAPAEPPPRRTREAGAFVRRFFERFDHNRDGAVDESELPLSIRRFGFWELDEDGDGRLVPAEIENAVHRHGRFNPS
ncbi:MAG TPA: alkyl hydroperoxide reductase, partial [Planctomycetaceae bacterium]|nr:alkyl hydroperoxide reductase [Planctomycetaceae bacterium]